MSSATNKPIKRMPGYRLALFGTALAALVIVLGAFTRLVDAGLGCPDWPGCYGQLLWPNDAAEIARAEQLFPDAPVEMDKTWPEMVHRYFAATLGLTIAALAFLGWKSREQESYPFRLPLFLLFVVVWQALFGMWTVTLKLWPQIVTLHLLGGVSTFSLLWLLSIRLDNHRWRVPLEPWQKLQTLKPWIITGIVIVVLQILLGGWTSANYAAFACPDLPGCHAEWWPEMNFAEGFNLFQSIGPNYLGGLMESEARVAIHVMHRVGAVITSVYVIGLCVALLRVPARQLNKVVAAIAAMLVIQLVLGVSNILLMVPLIVAVAHNGGGALLLLTLILLAARVWMAEPEPKSEETK